MTAGSTVIILPETNEQTLCVELTGRVRQEDHKKNLAGQLQKIIDRQGWYNLLVYYGPGYEGWEKDGAEISFQSIAKFGKLARRLAYVNPPEKKVFQNKISAPLFGGETRYFEDNELKQAMEWVKIT